MVILEEVINRKFLPNSVFLRFDISIFEDALSLVALLFLDSWQWLQEDIVGSKSETQLVGGLHGDCRRGLCLPLFVRRWIESQPLPLKYDPEENVSTVMEKTPSTYEWVAAYLMFNLHKYEWYVRIAWEPT